MSKNTIREAVKKAVSDQVTVNWRLAKLLHKVYYSKLWADWGFLSWEEYVEMEVGIHQTRAAAYRRLWHRAVYIWKLGEKDLPTDVSWTRLAILSRSPKVTERNIRGWLKKAPTLTCCALEHQVLGTHRASLSLSVSSRSQAEEIAAILDDVKEAQGFHSRAEALAEILRTWKYSHVYRRAA